MIVRGEPEHGERQCRRRHDRRAQRVAQGGRPPGQVGAQRPRQALAQRRAPPGGIGAGRQIGRHRQRVGQTAAAPRSGQRSGATDRPAAARDLGLPSRRCALFRPGLGRLRVGQRDARPAGSAAAASGAAARPAAARCAGRAVLQQIRSGRSGRRTSGRRFPAGSGFARREDCRRRGRARCSISGGARGLDRVAHGTAMHAGVRLPRLDVGVSSRSSRKVAGRGRRARGRFRPPPGAWRGKGAAARSPGSAAWPTAPAGERRRGNLRPPGKAVAWSSDSTTAMLSSAPTCCGAWP